MTIKVTNESMAENIGRPQPASVRASFCLCAGFFLPLSILSYIIT